MSASILIVDDEEPILTSLTSILQDEGYEVAVAKNGVEALRVYTMDPPDLVLLVCLVGVTCAAQSRPTKKSPSDASPISTRSIELAENGHCSEALPMLKRAMRQLADRVRQR